MIQYFLLFLITMITVESKEVPDINTTSLEEAQEVAILGGGCFWCTEAVFEKIGGVTDVVSGYAGGKSKNPTYKEICTGKSGHAEVIRITFNSKVLSYTKILEIFGKCHDTTTLNRQGADVGTQYRSTIMYLNETQKSIAEKWKQDFNKRLSSPVVTEIVKAPTFYVAEEYHQDYYARNPNQGYCSFVIRPKLKKLNLE
jgi:peptide-methionine (S)-S-oxide reductase